MSDNWPVPDEPTAEPVGETQADDSSETPVRRRTALWGRLAVGMFVLALAIVVGVDWLARINYNAALDALEEMKFAGSESGLPRDQVEKTFGGWYRRKDAPPDTLYTWVSLVRTYQIRLKAEPSQPELFVDYMTLGAGELETEPVVFPDFSKYENNLPPDPTAGPSIPFSAKRKGGGKATRKGAAAKKDALN